MLLVLLFDAEIKIDKVTFGIDWKVLFDEDDDD